MGVYVPDRIIDIAYVLTRGRVFFNVLQVSPLTGRRRFVVLLMHSDRSVVATIFTFLVFALWTVCFVPTALGFVRGTLFPAPCLSKLPPAYIEKLPGGETELVVRE